MSDVDYLPTTVFVENVLQLSIPPLVFWIQRHELDLGFIVDENLVADFSQDVL